MRLGCCVVAVLTVTFVSTAARSETPGVSTLMDLDRPGEAAALLLAAAREQGEGVGTLEQTFQAAQALWAAGQESSALERYLIVVTTSGATRQQRAVAAGRLNQRLAFPVSQTERLERLFSGQGHRAGALSPALQQGLAHRLGLYWLRRRDLERSSHALALASGRPGARYLEAVLALRRGKLTQARVRLTATRKLARELGQPGILELASLALARLALERGELEQASALYRTIPFGAPTFFRAQQELAWLHLRAGEHQAALARSAVLQAPALRIHHRPDRELVEAAALLGLCRTAQARERAGRALARLRSDEKRLRSFLRPRSDRRLYYVEAMASAARVIGAPAGDPIVGILLADPGFRRAFTVVRQLQRERRLLLRPSDDALNRELAKELDRRLVLAQQRAGTTVQGILTRASTELAELRARARELQFDVDERAIGEVVRRRSGQRHPPGTGDAGQQIAPGRQQTWPFVGEYWSDEIRHFVLPAPSRCGPAARRPRQRQR